MLSVVSTADDPAVDRLFALWTEAGGADDPQTAWSTVVEALKAIRCRCCTDAGLLSASGLPPSSVRAPPKTCSTDPEPIPGLGQDLEAPTGTDGATDGSDGGTDTGALSTATTPAPGPPPASP